MSDDLLGEVARYRAEKGASDSAAADNAARFHDLVRQFIDIASARGLPAKRVTMVTFRHRVIVRTWEHKAVGEARGWGPFGMGEDVSVVILDDGRVMHSVTEISQPPNRALLLSLERGELLCGQEYTPGLFSARAITESLAAYLA